MAFELRPPLRRAAARILNVHRIPRAREPRAPHAPAAVGSKRGLGSTAGAAAPSNAGARGTDRGDRRAHKRNPGSPPAVNLGRGPRRRSRPNGPNTAAALNKAEPPAGGRQCSADGGLSGPRVRDPDGRRATAPMVPRTRAVTATRRQRNPPRWQLAGAPTINCRFGAVLPN